MNLLFIRTIEGRILAGITMFVGMMILVGWVAINEEARMQAFVRQHTGRSIERGAELFASLCSECHGEEGYGAGDRAPGLNNPHLFGYDPVGSADGGDHERESGAGAAEQRHGELAD